MRGPGRPRRQTRARARGHRGAALLLALLLVALVATLASGMVWQQWRAVQVEAAERARAQAAWILDGAAEWARLIMREDGRTSSTDHGAEPWATPLAEARLSTFLAAERDSGADSDFDAFLSGTIRDAQARYNLRNLVDPTAGRVKADELRALERLCAALGVGADVPARVAAALAQAWGPAAQGAPDRPLPVTRFEHLAWLGLEPAVVEALRSHVDVLPRPAPLNLNTASREAIAAVLHIDAGTAERLVQRRQRRAFESPAQVREELPDGFELPEARVALASSHFVVVGQLRLEERVLEHSVWLYRNEGRVVVEGQRRQAALAAPP